MRLLFFLFTSLVFSFQSVQSQLLYLQDTWKGGVTGAGFSTGKGAGSANFDIHIEPGSTIKKAFLMTFRQGYPAQGSVKLNNQNFNFDYTDEVICFSHFLFLTYPQFYPLCVNIKDVTSQIDPFVTTYHAEIPVNYYVELNWGYWTVFLVVLYDNPLLPETNFALMLNDKMIYGNEYYSINELNPINNSNPVGFSIYTDRNCLSQSGTYVKFNGSTLGLLNKNDSVNENNDCSGVKGHFYYQNNQLYGLDDDTPNTTMGGSDGLADVSGYLNPNVMGGDFQLLHNNYPNNGNTDTPFNLAFFLSYTSPCQSFEATANYTCSGSTYQLAATGGIKYEWEPQMDLSCYNCPNPVFTGRKTTHYTCRIWSTDSCSKVLPLRIDVPKPDSIAIIPGICGNDDSKINFIKTTSGNSPYTFSIAGQNNSSGEFSGLASGAYTYTVTDTMGCVFSDTVNITESNLVKAGFLTKKFNDDLLKIDFINNSSNATHYIWIMSGGDTLYSENFTQLFDSGGSYQVILIAYNNYPHCADTIMHTIQVEHALVVLAPNVFTPNGDGLNDSFSINVKGAKEYSVSIFNRWGTEVNAWQKGSDMRWDGHTVSGLECSEGVYYYTITGTALTGEAFNKQGSFHLMR
ncbi:MAG: gliding motility-associated C-terminal domain-containing protein [Bacteroidota bacterium]|nr:gliding motility-associated C-terminal domain-containing protein [Bacteroidota bacterium]